MKTETAYYVTAGNNSTELGRVGETNSLLGAKRIGRDAVRRCLPNAEGSYRVKTQDGETVASEERSIRTGFKWR